MSRKPKTHACLPVTVFRPHSQNRSFFVCFFNISKVLLTNDGGFTGTASSGPSTPTANGHNAVTAPPSAICRHFWVLPKALLSLPHSLLGVTHYSCPDPPKERTYTDMGQLRLLYRPSALDPPPPHTHPGRNWKESITLPPVSSQVQKQVSRTALILTLGIYFTTCRTAHSQKRHLKDGTHGSKTPPGAYGSR